MAQILNTRRLVQSLDIQPSDFMLPLLEVVVNSIQSIEDSKNPKEGKITIKIVRDKQINIEENGFEEPYKPITGFQVVDNGVGFISKRYNAFQEAFTDINIEKGCKGVGRYTVLACFNNMEVESTFSEGNCINKRSFKFDIINDIYPDKDDNLTIIDFERQSLITKISLNEYKEDYYNYGISKRLTKESISETII